MELALIDTDILSEVLKARNANVLQHASAYLTQHGRLGFSAMTLYEMLRGLRAAKAIRQLRSFTEMSESSDVIPITIATLDRAASLWAEAHRNGYP